MAFNDLFIKAFDIFRRTRLIWFFTLINGLTTAASALMPDSKKSSLPMTCAFLCISLFALLLILFSQLGIPFVAARVWAHQPVSFEETWQHFKKRLVHLLLLVVAIALMVIVIAFIQFVSLIIFTGNSLQSPNWLNTVGWPIIFISLSLAFLFDLAFVAITLDPTGGFGAIIRGIKIFREKAWMVINLYLLYVLSYTALRSIIPLLYYNFFSPAKLNLLPSVSLYEQYQFLTESLPGQFVYIILTPFLTSIFTIMLVLIYLDAAKSRNTENVSAMDLA